MDEAYPIETGLDVIFCRNILIYFDKATQARVLSRLCSHLAPGGYLFLGHSESIVGIDLPVLQIANTVFRSDSAMPVGRKIRVLIIDDSATFGRPLAAGAWSPIRRSR